ncbi:hypothetical protein HON88_05975 [Candidatus Woesearchaeota archaeon]|nr:hypothetical protein [Candidatus Woesearchaeota archaeon]MBT6041776.1 hypothetical protein [Candidatus Woesearchaeota archaeon]
MKIAVYGSASGKYSEETNKKARIIGREIAKQGHILVTGACSGYPYEAVLGAKEEKGKTIGFSPARNKEEHISIAYPIEGFDEMIFIPEKIPTDYIDHNDDIIRKITRNLASTSHTDAAIIIAGGSGTLDEFNHAFCFGKKIGILKGSGGVTKRVIPNLIEDNYRDFGAKVFFEEDPIKLVNKIVNI